MIYEGIRGDKFREFLFNLFKKYVPKLKSKYIKWLLCESNMEHFKIAFTAESADPINNYEQFEQLGDLSVNKFIVSYAYKKFPQINCPQGVRIASQLRILYGGKKELAKIADSIGLWPYISALEEIPVGEKLSTKKTRNKNKKGLLEDCFESFLGCVEYLLDNIDDDCIGFGYNIVYSFLSNIFDEYVRMSIKYEDLFDSRTRIKEIFDKFKKEIGTMAYTYNYQNIPNSEYLQVVCETYRIPLSSKVKAPRVEFIQEINKQISWPCSDWILIGTGTGCNKDDATVTSTNKALEYLKSQGIYKEPDIIYKQFCESNC